MVMMDFIRMRVLAGLAIALVFTVALPPQIARADTVKVLTAGAFKQVLLAVIPQFEASGNKVVWDNDTAGGLVKRIEAGESFDLVIASPAALDTLAKSGKVEAGRESSTGTGLARVGVGVAVREGAAKPDVATVEAFRKTMLAARAIAYIDPTSGGSSGIYLTGLFDRLGIADAVKAKAVLVKGGYAAERLVSGEADIAVHQISELLPVKGVTLLGPLPAEIQSYTVYAGGIAAGTPRRSSAQALIDLLRGPVGAAAIESKGMEPVDRATPAKN
jgi:molybdate transport system substrate-binding protein